MVAAVVKKLEVNAGMPECLAKVSTACMGIFTVSLTRQSGIGIPASGHSGTTVHGVVRHCQAKEQARI
jgi:hypothetical protein